MLKWLLSQLPSTAICCLALYSNLLLKRKNRKGWAVGIVGEVAWIVWALMLRPIGIGIIVMALIFSWQFWRAWIAWGVPSE